MRRYILSALLPVMLFWAGSAQAQNGSSYDATNGNSSMSRTSFVVGKSAQSQPGFKTDIEYRCGLSNKSGSSLYNLQIGMDTLGTDELDRKLDSPAPPIPPEICYAWLLAPSGEYPFNLLWKDIRGLSDCALFRITATRGAGGGDITIKSLPEGYTLYINGARADLGGSKMAFPESDSILPVIAVKGSQKATCAIMADSVATGKAELVIKGAGGKKIETINFDKPAGDGRLFLFTPKSGAGEYDFSLVQGGKTTAEGRFVVPAATKKGDTK